MSKCYPRHANFTLKWPHKATGIQYRTVDERFCLFSFLLAYNLHEIYISERGEQAASGEKERKSIGIMAKKGKIPGSLERGEEEEEEHRRGRRRRDNEKNVPSFAARGAVFQWAHIVLPLFLASSLSTRFIFIDRLPPANRCAVVMCALLCRFYPESCARNSNASIIHSKRRSEWVMEETEARVKMWEARERLRGWGRDEENWEGILGAQAKPRLSARRVVVVLSAFNDDGVLRGNLVSGVYRGSREYCAGGNFCHGEIHYVAGQITGIWLTCIYYLVQNIISPRNARVSGLLLEG